MSQHIMGSPSKKVRHESTSSSYLGNHAPESPIQQTSTGANPDQSLLDFEFSDTPTFGGGGTPTLSYLPSIVPNSKDWIMSPTATFSAVPEGFGADPLSPGFSSGVPSRTASLKLGNNGHARPFRNAHKRGGGAGSNSSLYDESEFEELNGASSGVGGLSAGIALSPGAAVMDEESQEHLSTNKKALADILSRKNYRGGRATPDVGLATSEESHHPHQQQQHQQHQQQQNYQSEGTRLGLGSSQRGSVGSHSNLSYSNSTYSHSNHGHSNHSHSNLSHSNLSASQAGHSHSHSQGSSNGQGAGAGPFTTSFANFSAATAQGGATGSLFELAAAQASLSGVGANKSTPSSRTLSNSNKTTGAQVKTEKGAARSQGESTTATTTSTNMSGGGAGMEEDGPDSRGEEEDGDDNSSNHHSQQSAASSHMAGVLAITAAAEYLPFPSSDERAPAGSNKTARAGGGTPGKKAKPRRSYGNTSSSTSASFSTEGVKNEQLHDGEHSNLSCESNSSGHSGVGGGVHGSGVKSSGASVATSASAISANFLATYGTPAMKLTSSIAASASSSKPITCNCKRSKCLKMYCDCFRLTLYCKDSCRCKECANVESKAAERQAAISSIVERNPEAFKPRVTADPVSNSKGHLTGCHCRKSSCLKKYCECFTGAVPCGERCRCLDCKNAPAIYGSDLKHRLSLSSALGAPGIDRSNPRKDSIGSEGNMDVMSAIMNDKQQRGFGSSGLRTDLATHSLGSPHMSSSMALMSGGGLSGLGGGLGGLGGAPYFDPEMSNLSTASLSYSNEAFHHGGAGLSGLGYGDLTSHGFLHKAGSSSKLGGGLGSLGNLGSLGAPFSPPRPGTDPSSGANSNRSVLDNDEAAEVLSVMNSPNAYMTIPPFGGGTNNNGSHGLQDASMTTAGPMFRYRDSHLGSHTGMSSAGTQGSRLRAAFGAHTKSLLRAEDFDDEDEKGDGEDQHVPVSAPGSVVRHTAGMALASALSIDTEDAPTAAAATVSGSSAYFSPSASAYSSPVKPRRPISELAVQSPTLLHLAALCEQQEELEKDRTFASPAKTRSYP